MNVGPLQDSKKNPVFQMSRIIDTSALDFTVPVASNCPTQCDFSPYCSLNTILYLMSKQIHYVMPK